MKVRVKEVIKVGDQAIVSWDQNKEKTMRALKAYVMKMQSVSPVDQLGRPLTLVNSLTLLATGLNTPVAQLIDSPPEGVAATIDYHEGLPTIDGIPIWEKLEFEPLEYYQWFKRYRMLKEVYGNRSIYRLAVESGAEVRTLDTLKNIYHWGARIEAYDQYMEAERQSLLEMKRIGVENRHAGAAERLFKVSSQYLLDHEELLTPKVALQMLDVAWKLERLSVGLSDKGFGGQAPTVNIQNNLSNNTTPEKNTITGEKEADAERLMQILNVMNNIGALSPEEVVEVEVQDIE